MAFYDTADAIYGTGLYGTARYDRVTPVVQVTGVSATANTRTIHLNVFEVDISEPIYNAQGATGSVGGLTLHTTAGVIGVSATGTANTLGVGVDVTLGSVSATVSTNTVFENLTLRPWTYDDDNIPIVGTSSLGSITVKTINTISVLGVSASGLVNNVQEVKTTAGISSPTVTLSLGTIKPNINKIVNSISASINTPSATAKNNSKIVSQDVVGTGQIGQVGGGPAEEIATGVEAIGFVGSVTTHIVEKPEKAIGTGEIGEPTITAVVFNFQAVKNQYSRRRTVLVSRAA